MGRVGRADIHRIELFGTKHLAHRPVAGGDSPFLGERTGPTAVSARHRRQVGTFHYLNGGQELPGDVAVADHAKPKVVCFAHAASRNLARPEANGPHLAGHY